MNEPAPLPQLGRYRIVRVVGRGAMGVVYEGVDPRLNRQVAIKTIRKGELLDPAAAADYSERFVREARAAARLHHPHIVTIFDFGEEGEIAYIVMEFVRGRELKSYFDNREFFDLPEAIRIMCEFLDALGYAHEHGIVHRDVKPANVMLDAQHRVKLTDFGVARMADSSHDRTLAGTVVGTPSYMSPEQIQGQAVGSRSDLFAAGVILYQFLTHKKPFAGPAQWTLQMQIVQDNPVAPSVANESVPRVFDEIIRRALAKEPGHRYASAGEFATDLKRALVLAAIPNEGTRIAASPAPKVADPTVVAIHDPASQPTVISVPSDTPTPTEADVGVEEPTVPFAPRPATEQDVGEASETRRHPVKTPSEAAASEVRRHGYGYAQKSNGVFRRNAEWLVSLIGGTIALVAVAVLVSFAMPHFFEAGRVEPEPLVTDKPASQSPPPATPPVEQPAPRPASERKSEIPATRTSEPVQALDEPSAPPAVPKPNVAAPRAPASVPKADIQRAAPPPRKADVAATKPARAIEGDADAPAQKSEAKPKASAGLADGARRQRCDDYLQRLQIGDVLSDADQAFFQRECKR